MFREALAIRDRILPPIHPRTAYVLEGLAVSLVGQSRPDDAEPYYLRAIAIWDRVDKGDYESCHHGTVLDGLGRIYFQAGTYEKAEPLFERALDVWTKGRDHCAMIRSVMDDLAALYWAQGKMVRCGEMYERTIPLLEKGLGDQQPEMIAEQRVKLARVYMAEKRPAEAVSLLQQAIPILERSGPSERETLLQSLKNEAMLLGELHRDSEIPRVEGQVDAILGIKSQSVEPMVRWQGLMGLLNHSTDLAQREQLLQQAMAEAEKLGPGIEQARTLEILASVQMGTRKFEQSEISLKRALPINEKVFGPESVEVAHNYELLAVAYQTQSKPDQQESALRQEVAILEKLPKESTRLSIATQTFGDFYFRQKKYPEAETAYLQSLRSAEQLPPEVMLASAAQRLGRLYEAWEKPEQAVTYYARAVALERSNPSPLYVSDLQTLSQLLRKLNRPSEAQPYDQERQQAIDHLMRAGATVSITK